MRRNERLHKNGYLRISKDNFGWGTAFRERVWASLYCSRHAKPLQVGKKYHLRSRTPNVSLVDLSATYDNASSRRALNILLSVLRTSAPSLSRVTPKRESTQTSTQSNSLGHTSRTTPVFYDPPISYTPTPSKNIAWFEAALANGYPPLLSMKLTTEKADFAWDDTEEARAFYQLISYTGFIPVQTTQDDQTVGRVHIRGRPSKAHASGSNSNAEGGPQVPILTPLDMDEAAQRERARHLARTRTYNLKYLKRRRHWGPFLPLSKPSENSVRSPQHDSGAASSGPSGSKPLINVSSEDLLMSDSDSSDDSDFIPAEEDEADMDFDSSAASLSPVPPPARVRLPRLLPTPDQLVADWAWLASARIVVEANLKEMEGLPEGIEALASLDNVREGAWSGSPMKNTDEGDNRVDEKGKGKDNGNNAELNGRVDGWDWAGVEGVWR